jgi:hypothetical protein
MKTQWGAIAIAGMMLSGCGEEVDRIDLSGALSLVGSTQVVGVTYTAFDPFNHAMRGAKCGDMGVFRPSRLYDRRYNNVPGLWTVDYVNRIFEVPSALTGDWSIRVPRESLDNEFGGVMYHFEVRAVASGAADIDGRGGRAVQDETILEGCTCLVDTPHQLYRWRDVDDCVPRFDLDGPIPAAMEPVAPPEFVLQDPPLASFSLTERGDVLLEPGLVIANVDPDACRTDRCDDLSLVPVAIEVEGGTENGVSIDPDHQVLVTDENGRVVPRLQVEDCREDFELKATVVGTEAGVTVNVRCG